MTAKPPPEPSAPRLDKWLWAARFFKTRALARAAIEGGKIQVNGERAKASRHVALGQVLAIQTPGAAYTVTVLGLSEQRGPAPQAQALYAESAESRAKREQLAAEHRLHADEPGRRPDKKQRRQILRFLDTPE